MNSKVTRRGFLKFSGATGLTAVAFGYASQTLTAKSLGSLTEETTADFKEFCGIPDPILSKPGELKMRGIGYPYQDKKTEEWFYHAPIRETVDMKIPRKPLTKAVDLLTTLPQAVVSANGVLKYDLEVKMGKVVVNGQTLTIRSYNGGFPGPTLIVQPGEMLQIHHTNNLPETPNEAPHTDMNHPHGFNVINLHTHGINGSPLDNEDNPLLTILPGESFDYEIDIHDKHPTGTFWYHPHKHGATSNHVGSGMAGLLFIVDPKTDIRAIPEIAAAKEVPLILQELFIKDNEDGTGFVPDWPTSVEEFYYGPETRIETTINGTACNETQLDGSTIVPEIHMQPGEVQHWRFAHAGMFVNMILGIDDHKMHIVSYDGITLENVETAEEFVITSGQRRDILVKASMKPGTYAVKRKRYKQAQQINTWPERVIFNIVVEGKPNDMPLPTKLNPPSALLPYIRKEEIVAERKIEMQFVDNTAKGIFVHLMDKKLFDPTHVDLSMVRGTAEKWHICNGLSSDHPFHIHINWFELHQVVDKDGKITKYDPPIWMDVVNVPRGGYATIVQRFDRFQGLSVLHCHILPHEDEGMMSVIDIIDGEPKTEKISSTEGGVLLSPEYDNRVHVAFLPRAFASDAEVTYEFNSSPIEPTIRPAPKLGEGMSDYNRFFTLTAKEEGKPVNALNRACIITVKYSQGQAQPASGSKVPLSRIKLHHYDEAKKVWSADSSSVISQSSGSVTCSTRKLGKFALTGIAETCYDLTGDNLVDKADIALVTASLDTPYRYFKEKHDFNADGEVTEADIKLVSDQMNNPDGAYCRQ